MNHPPAPFPFLGQGVTSSERTHQWTGISESISSLLFFFIVPSGGSESEAVWFCLVFVVVVVVGVLSSNPNGARSRRTSII